jgi:hypothetical protein
VLPAEKFNGQWAQNMEYQVHLGDQHKIVLSAKDSPDGKFTVRELRVDLSRANLFMDQNREPDKTGAQHALIPLAEQACTAFADIDKASTISPLVHSLKTYRETRLPTLLSELKQLNPPEQIDFTKFKDPQNQRKFELALRATVREIEREFPHYFRTEKELGTLDWLKDGGLANELPISLASQRPLEMAKMDGAGLFLADVSGRFIAFDATRNTAHVLTGDNPSAQRVIEALCNSGTLGHEFSELNRGIALKLVATPATKAAEFFSEIETIKKDALNYKPSSALWTVTKAIIPAMLGASIIAAPVVTNTINNSLTALDLVRTVLGCVLGYLATHTARLALRNREAQTRMRDQIRERIEAGVELPNPSGVGPLNIYSTALIDQTVHSSTGNPNFRLAPKHLDSWMEDLPKLRFPDRSCIPAKTTHFMGIELSVPIEDSIKEPISIDSNDDSSEQELNLGEIKALTFEPIVRIIHIERAFETWNILQANSLLKEFADRQGLPTADAPWLDRKQALIQGLASQTDESNTYPEASKTFSALTEYFKLNVTSWGHVSRALASAALLERMYETNRAQVIAQKVFKSIFG